MLTNPPPSPTFSPWSSAAGAPRPPWDPGTPAEGSRGSPRRVHRERSAVPGSAPPVGLTCCQAVPVQQLRAWHLRARAPPGKGASPLPLVPTSTRAELASRTCQFSVAANNTRPPTGWLREHGVTETNPLAVPEARTLRPACWQDPLARRLRARTRARAVQLLGPSVSSASSARGHVTPPSLYSPSRHLLLSICLSVCLSNLPRVSFVRAVSLDSGSTRIGPLRLEILNSSHLQRSLFQTRSHRRGPPSGRGRIFVEADSRPAAVGLGAAVSKDAALGGPDLL